MSDFMLCNSIKEEEFKNIDLSSWIGEDKKDGERIIAVKEGIQVWLFNRRGREKSSIYSEIVKELQNLKEDFIVDGEVTTTDGLFNSLQHRSNLSDKQKIKEAEFKYPITFWVFDILLLNKLNLRNKPLIERKKYLECLRGLESIQILNHFEGENIKELWGYIKENKKEGIILKKKNSPYVCSRSDSWIKLKNFKEITIEFSHYEVNNSGLKLSEGIYEIQVQDDSSDRVERIKEKIDKGKKVKVEVQYLELTNDKKLRFPSCKRVL